MRVQRLRCCAGGDFYHFLRKLNRIIKSHTTFTLTPDQAVAHAHLPGEHM
jgi:hypothetical protein